MQIYFSLNQFKEKIDKKLWKLEDTEQQLIGQQALLEKALARQNLTIDCRALIQRAVSLTQEQLKYKISNIVTQALSLVFPDPYEFKVEFVERRNSTECDLLFSRGGEDYDPLESAGHGAADVASFTLRISYWLLSATAPFILLDEPFRHLSEDMQPAAAEMLRMLAKEFDLQFLIVSHEEEITNCADRRYDFQLVNRIAQATMI
jgi:hypothetical protein